MSEELTVVGLVQHKNEDKAKGKYGIKLGDRWYNGFGVLPNYVVEDAKVKLTYFDKQGKDKNGAEVVYHNVIDGGIAQADEDDEVSPKEAKKDGQTSLDADYKSGGDIDHLTDVVDNVLMVYGKCFEGVGKVMNRDLKALGKEELSCVNSVFIEVCKRLK